MQRDGVCCFTKTDAHQEVRFQRRPFAFLEPKFAQSRVPPQLPQTLAMEMDRKTPKGDSNNPTEATTQMASVMPLSDEELAITVITTYLLAQSKEFRQLSQLRQQVSFHSCLWSNHWHVTNNNTRDGRTLKAISFSPTNVPVQMLHTRALRSKQSRARKSSSR